MIYFILGYDEHEEDDMHQTANFSEEDKFVVTKGMSNDKTPKHNDSQQVTNPFSPNSVYNTTNNKLNEQDIQIEVDNYRKEKKQSLNDLEIKNELEEEDLQRQINELEDGKDKEINKEMYSNLTEELEETKIKNSSKVKDMKK
jgi:hypothetical protein